MQGIDLQRKGKELAAELDYYVKSHFEQLVEQFVDCFSEYCNKIYEMQRQGRKGAIAYIHFSVLQTNILLKKHEIRLDAYDENWFLDYVECSDSYHVGEFYSYLEQYGDLVEELRKKSNGKTSLAEAQRRVFAESKLYLFYIAELIRAGMRKVVQTEAYQRIERAPCFVVCIGGYLDRFDINAEEGVKYDVATEKDTSAQLFSMLLPMLLMSFLFSGCMAVAPESIVGEKERGTIATLLVTPMKRSELAVGKVLSLSVIGLLGGVSSFIGTMLALPNLMGGAALEDDSMTGAMSAAVYSGTDYVLLLFVILSTVLVIIGAISLMSGLAKSVKEAGTMVSPLMIVVMLIGVSTMFGDGAPKEVYWYLIPFYNSVQCMNGIFSFDLVPVNFVVTIVANLLYALVMTAGLAKIFDSEKIMYS